MTYRQFYTLLYENNEASLEFLALGELYVYLQYLPQRYNWRSRLLDIFENTLKYPFKRSIL